MRLKLRQNRYRATEISHFVIEDAVVGLICCQGANGTHRKIFVHAISAVGRIVVRDCELMRKGRGQKPYEKITNALQEKVAALGLSSIRTTNVPPPGALA